MFEALLVLGVAILGVIAHQLYGIRQRLDENARVEEAARKDREFDETIRDACPTLFYQFRSDLRDWFRVHERKREYYEEHRAYGNAMSPHSDEESSWFDVFQRLLKGANDTQKTALGEISSVTDRFLKEATAKTVLKPAEMNFLAYRAWHDFLDEGGEAVVLGIVCNHLKERLDPHVETYRRFATSSQPGTSEMPSVQPKELPWSWERSPGWRGNTSEFEGGARGSSRQARIT